LLAASREWGDTGITHDTQEWHWLPVVATISARFLDDTAWEYAVEDYAIRNLLMKWFKVLKRQGAKTQYL